MRFFHAIVCTVLVFESLSFAWAGDEIPSGLGVQSRNMPEECEFVFRVESDITVAFQDPSIPDTSRLELIYGFEDIYQPESRWLNKTAVPMIPQGNGTWSASMTYETMSTHQHRLWRTMDFYLLITTDGSNGVTLPSQASDTRFFRVEFGRQFGERCEPGGRDDTPFLKRGITLSVAR